MTGNDYSGMKRALAAQQAVIDSLRSRVNELSAAAADVLTQLGYDARRNQPEEWHQLASLIGEKATLSIIETRQYNKEQP